MLKNVKNSKGPGISGFKGIVKIPTGYRAEVNITVDDSKSNSEGKKRNRFYLGTFPTIKKAKKARLKFILEML